jgi:hypothetical protein
MSKASVDPSTRRSVLNHYGAGQKCKSNADIIDRYRRLLIFWADHKCSVVDVSRNLVIVVVIVAGGKRAVQLYSQLYMLSSLRSQPSP